MNTQFGLGNLWDQGDLITQGLVVLLFVMSLWSWIVIVSKALDLRKFAAQARATERFWRATDFADGLNQLGPDPSNPFRALAMEGREAATHHNAQSRLHDSLDGSEWLTRSLRNSIDASTARLQSGLAVLASVGSTAPFVGLLGTVWGIYHALMSISTAGQATIDRVAGPIGEALIMTALGLAVAIPAVLGYNALVRGNKSVIHKLNRFAHDLHAYFLTGARVSAHADPKVVPMKNRS
jgi:biopolymer transport protein ExbB